MTKVVAIGDLHVGSRVGLAIPGEPPTEDRGAPVRDALYAKWREAVESPWGNPDVLIVNGDAVDGQGKRAGGTEQWTTSVDDQVQMAAKLIRMWGAKTHYVIRGSDYHVELAGTGVPVEELLARKLEAEFYPNNEHIPEENRPRSGWHWYITIDGVTMHVQHKIGVSKVWHYRTTPLAREMLYTYLGDKLREDMKNHFKTRIVLRSHAHYCLDVGYTSTRGFVLPCWQGDSPFIEKMGPLAINADGGFVGFEIEDGEYSFHKEVWPIEIVQKPPHTVHGKRRQPRRRKGRARKAG